MKQFVLAIVALCLLTPAIMAAETVTVWVVDQGDASGWATINYSVTGGTDLARAFALNVTVNNGANIVELDQNSYVKGESTAAARGYGIFLGTVEVDGVSGQITDYGTPVAPAGDPGALGDIPGPGITLEMGSLYKGEPNAPLATGTLCKLRVDKSCHMSLAQEAARGGIVMETVGNTPTVVLNGADITVGGGCATCPGDVNGDSWVTFDDLLALYQALQPAPGYYESTGCDDFNGDYWATFDDLLALYQALQPAPGYYQCP